jgi:hypothetical protein
MLGSYHSETIVNSFKKAEMMKTDIEMLTENEKSEKQSEENIVVLIQQFSRVCIWVRIEMCGGIPVIENALFPLGS